MWKPKRLSILTNILRSHKSLRGPAKNNRHLNSEDGHTQQYVNMHTSYNLENCSNAIPTLRTVN